MHDSNPTEAVLVSIEAAARRLGISRRTMYSRIALGSIPTVRLGGRIVRIDPADLEIYITESKSNAPPARATKSGASRSRSSKLSRRNGGTR